MKGIKPSFEEAMQYGPEYDLVPICYEIMADIITPIELLKKLKNQSKHCYLLESVINQEYWGRYTFLGYEPKLDLVCRNQRITLKDAEGKVLGEEKGHPGEYMKKLLSQYKSPKISGMPSFTGGLVGYFAYDYMKYNEPKLSLDALDEEGFQDIDLMLFDKVIAFDNVKQKIILVANVAIKDGQAGYEVAEQDIKEMLHIILYGEAANEVHGTITTPITPLFEEREFVRMVEKAKQYIYEGDIFQVVLSNRLEAGFEGSLLDMYRVLRTINPSPYMFYMSGDEVEVAGASPETLVKLEDGMVHTYPLAGTRPRGATPEEDERVEKELLADEKERAEHNMLVDLGRNDIGRIAKFGSVMVDKYMNVERFSHVMHIGSSVKGTLREDLTPVDVINSILPAGTLSGAPKLRACEIINELENNKRGIYGGAIGYIAFTGNLDTCIAIRIAYKKGKKVFVRSGAGIVADSVPESEYKECVNKAKAVMNALSESQNLKLQLEEDVISEFEKRNTLEQSKDTQPIGRE